MKKLLLSLIDAFQPSSVRGIARQAESEAEEKRRRQEKHEEEARKSRDLLQTHFAPCIDVLAALPEKDGKTFHGRTKAFSDVPCIKYGSEIKSDSIFWVEKARKTIFGNVHYTKTDFFLDELSQRGLAREFAKWVYNTAPERMDEVRHALEQSSNPQARALAPKT